MAITTKRFSDLARARFSPERLDSLDREVEQELLEMNLQALRKAASRTQKQLANLTRMTQPELSNVESRDDHRVSTLRRYVKALGGRVEVIAIFPDKKVRLVGV
jgi:uncharacterized caspase-like protein